MRKGKQSKKIKPELINEEIETKSINTLLEQTDILIRECQELITQIESDMANEDQVNQLLDSIGNKKRKTNKNK